MQPLAGTFDHCIDFDPARPMDELLSAVPARWAVYLFAGPTDQPIQLLCVRNLRASLKRRLGGDQAVGPSRKVNYRDLVRRIHWRRVDSAFEADLVYLEIARRVFPASYRGAIGFDPAWFIHVNPEQNFPRYVKTIDLARPEGVYIGPVADKHVAARLIQLIEDAFDLCRFYNILIESPHARACAYKEMGKCPAPCDGSVSLPQYREMIRWSAQVAVAPDLLLRQTTQRMEAAARELNFEAAARIRQYLEQLQQLGNGPLRHARRLENFRYLSLQTGPRNATAKLFLITPGRVEEIAGLFAPPTAAMAPQLLRNLLHTGASRPPDLGDDAAPRIGVIAAHLLRGRRGGGVFIPLDQLEERSLTRAWRELQRIEAPPQSEEEELIKELQQV